ncbi:MAG: response regulator, partial [Oscillochloris sp.]|nr:response regulator [Oscillochloris sp.]
GEGTTFRLTLLLGIAVAESDQATVPQIAAQRTPQVLIVEDNTINQEVLRRMVEQLGALPTVTNNGQEAVNALCRATYDIVLMDIQMPVLDGEKATRLIRDMGSTIVQPQIVALTASALRGDRERYLEAGMDDYLSKPVQLDDLRRVFLRRSVDERQAALASEESASNSGANIDWATIERLLFSLQLPKDQAATLVCELYEHELANQLHTLSAAIESDDRSLIARLAHKLRGGSRQLGANGLAAACMALEVAAKDPSATSLTDDIANVRASYTETWSLIQAQLQTMIAAH